MLMQLVVQAGLLEFHVMEPKRHIQNVYRSSWVAVNQNYFRNILCLKIKHEVI